MRHIHKLTACVVACGLAWTAPVQGQGSPTKTSGTISTAAEVGFRGFMEEPSAIDKGKLEEYRQLSKGLLLERARLVYTPADSFGIYQLVYRRPSDRDQSLWLQAMRPGLYNFQINWEKFQHLYSTDAKSPGIENSPMGFNTLPTPRPDSTAWRNAGYIGEVRSVWDPMKMSLDYTPTHNADFKAEYLRTAKYGGLPNSISFNGSSGPTREYVTPIDQLTNDVRLSHSFTSNENTLGLLAKVIKRYQFTVSYDFSKFTNNMKSVMVDNPQLAVSSQTLGAATSRVSLAPDNSSHTATLVGAMWLPLNTRVTGSASGSWQFQNDLLLPQTSNDSLSKVANYNLVSSNMRPSLDGKVQMSTVNISATSRPIKGLSLAAKYRNFSYSNKTAPFQLQAMIVSDRSIALADSEKMETDPYNKINTDVSASYELLRGLQLQVGFGMEDWNRNADVRNTPNTREKTPRVAIDYNGLEWVSLHASHSRGTRRYDSYTTSGTEITNFRRFDVSNRDRDRSTLLATFTPFDELQVGLSYVVANDSFPGSQYGTTSDKSTMSGVDIDWTPSKTFAFSVGFTNESIDNILQMRYRTGAVGSVTDDNPTFKWTNTNQDRNATVYASVNMSLIPDVLDAQASISRMQGSWHMLNVNAGVPTGGTAANMLAATVESWPEVTSETTPMSFALRYRVNESWGLTLRYQQENYKQTDFRTSVPLFTSTTLAGSGTPLFPNWWTNLPGAVGTLSGSNVGTYHFLGNNYNPYNAQWLTFSVSWHPAALPIDIGRPTF